MCNFPGSNPRNNLRVNETNVVLSSVTIHNTSGKFFCPFPSFNCLRFNSQIYFLPFNFLILSFDALCAITLSHVNAIFCSYLAECHSFSNTKIIGDRIFLSLPKKYCYFVTRFLLPKSGNWDLEFANLENLSKSCSFD